MTYTNILSALGDPTRRAMLERLTVGPARARELQELLSLSQPAISQHLKVLREAGLIEVNEQERPRHYYCVPGTLKPLQTYLQELTSTGQSGAPTSPWEPPTPDTITVASQRWAEAWPGQNAYVYAITMRLLQLGRNAERALRETAERRGLQANELLLLDALTLSEKQALTPSQLQKRLGITKGGITKILDRLEGLGLIQRLAGESDRRVSLISLTQKARKMLETILVQTEYGADHAAVKRLSTSEMTQLNGMLQKFHALVEDELSKQNET